MFDFSTLDIIRDFFGYYTCILMSIWVYQRSSWIAATRGSMRKDARAVQCVALCMIISILVWQIIFPQVGTTKDTMEFVLFAIFTRCWLLAASALAVCSHWAITEGVSIKTSIKRILLIGLIPLAVIGVQWLS